MTTSWAWVRTIFCCVWLFCFLKANYLNQRHFLNANSSHLRYYPKKRCLWYYDTNFLFCNNDVKCCSACMMPIWTENGQMHARMCTVHPNDRQLWGSSLAAELERSLTERNSLNVVQVGGEFERARYEVLILLNSSKNSSTGTYVTTLLENLTAPAPNASPLDQLKPCYFCDKPQVSPPPFSVCMLGTAIGSKIIPPPHL